MLPKESTGKNLSKYVFGKYFLSRSHKAIDRKTEIGLHQNLNFSFSKYNVKKMKGKRDTGENICNNLLLKDLYLDNLRNS